MHQHRCCCCCCCCCSCQQGQACYLCLHALKGFSIFTANRDQVSSDTRHCYTALLLLMSLHPPSLLLLHNSTSAQLGTHKLSACMASQSWDKVIARADVKDQTEARLSKTPDGTCHMQCIGTRCMWCCTLDHLVSTDHMSGPGGDCM